MPPGSEQKKLCPRLQRLDRAIPSNSGGSLHSFLEHRLILDARHRAQALQRGRCFRRPGICAFADKAVSCLAVRSDHADVRLLDAWVFFQQRRLWHRWSPWCRRCRCPAWPGALLTVEPFSTLATPAPPLPASRGQCRWSSTNPLDCTGALACFPPGRSPGFDGGP